MVILLNLNLKKTLFLLLLLFLFCALLFTKLSLAKSAQSIDKIIAVVNNDIVLQSELNHFINRVVRKLKARKTAIPARHILEKQALERLILLRIQIQLAKRKGVKVSDEMVNQALANVAKKNKMTLIQFRKQIGKEGLDFKELRESIRKEIILARLQQRSVRNQVRVSKEEIDRFLANQTHRTFKNNKFKVQHILISVPDGADAKTIQQITLKAKKVLKRIKQGVKFSEAAVTWSDGQKALEGGVLGWFRTGQLPRIFVRQVVKLKVGQVSSLIRSPSGFHIVKLIDARGANQKRIVTKYNSRHVLIRTSDLISNTSAKKRLHAIRERVINGENFAQLAKAHSDDTFSARKGGDLGWIGPGDTVPRFEAVLKKTAKGEVSQPFQSKYGWHIVQVIDKKKHDDTKNFKRTGAMRLLRSRKQRELLQAWLRKLRDESYVEYRNKNRNGS